MPDQLPTQPVSQNSQVDQNQANQSFPSVADSSDTPPPPIIFSQTPSSPGSTKPGINFLNKKIVATILGLLLLIGGVTAGVVLVQQNQEIREKAAGGLGANAQISADPINPDGTTEYYINTSIEYPANSNKYIKDHQAWINHQGTNAGQERGLFHWAKDQSDLPSGSISCECGNQGQCEPGHGFATLKSGSDYVNLVRCTAWSNTVTNNGNANHAVLFFFKALSKWGIDGPLTLNDISTKGTNVDGEVLDWINSDLNFKVIGTGVSASCLNIKAFTSTNNWTTWNQLDSAEELSALKAGDHVRFTVAGSTDSGNFDKAQFTINDVTLEKTEAKKPGTNDEFYSEYTIPEGVSEFKIAAKIHHAQLDQWF